MAIRMGRIMRSIGSILPTNIVVIAMMMTNNNNNNNMPELTSTYSFHHPVKIVKLRYRPKHLILHPRKRTRTTSLPKRESRLFRSRRIQEVESNTTTTERKKQMDIKDIVQRISLAVPPIVSLRVNGTPKNDWLPIVTTEEDSDKAGIDIAGVVETFAKNKEEGSIVGGSAAAAEGGYLPQPIGQILKTYHRKVRGAVSNSNTKCYVDVDSSTSEFVIALADGSDRLDHHTPPSTVARYHNSVQRLARWYIETADGVDVAEDGRGFWKVMYLFRRHNHNHGDDDGSGTSSSSRRLSLAGYMTLLHVHSPFRKPFPGIIVRVCQGM